MTLRPFALVAIATCMVSFGLPGMAQQGLPRNSSDSTWEPRSYGLNGVQAPGSGGVRTFGPNASCTPSVRKVGEGPCANGARAVAYADGCGGQTQAVEACAAGTWEWYYRGTGLGGGGTSTSSVAMLACVQSGTGARLADSSCGPMPTDSASPCLIGQSYQTQLPACAASVGPRVKYPTTIDAFWGAGASRNF